MERPNLTFGFLSGMMATAVPLIAHAEIYLTEEQALKAIFPNAAAGDFKRSKISLSADDKRKIEVSSNETVRNLDVVVWTNSKKEVVIIDQALGKHEFITYAAGFTPNPAKIKSIEILEYRETYGSQVKGEAWRKQFQDKDLKAPLKIGKDIVNISGATLSSAHITGGVRRLLQTYDIIHSKF